MPQLETLVISFLFPVPNRNVERQLMRTPIITPVTLPNLRLFMFRGVSAYVEAVIRWIITPRLEVLSILFFSQLTFSVPRILQFVNTTENIRFDSARFEFSNEKVYVDLHSRRQADTHVIRVVYVVCPHLDWQVSSVAQMFDSLSQIFSTVEHPRSQALGA